MLRRRLGGFSEVQGWQFRGLRGLGVLVIGFTDSRVLRDWSSGV